MDLQWLIKLVDQLVAENPETTVKDYLELVDELKAIEIKSENPRTENEH